MLHYAQGSWAGVNRSGIVCLQIFAYNIDEDFTL